MLQRLTHAVFIAGIYIITFGLFNGFYQKFSGAPGWIVGMMADSPLAFTTGFAWFMIGIMQMVSLALIFVSAFKLEFFQAGEKIWLKASSAVGFMCMSVMGMGTGMAGKYDEMASFSVYMVVFGVFYLIATQISKESK